MTVALRLAPYAHSVNHHLVSTVEIAAILGVTRQRVQQIIKTDDTFPAPVADLSIGKVWNRDAVETWKRLSPERRPGRPKKD